MVLLASKTNKFELVATAANAMAHHNLMVPLDQAAERLVEIAEGRGDEKWLRDKIDDLGNRISTSN